MKRFALIVLALISQISFGQDTLYLKSDSFKIVKIIEIDVKVDLIGYEVDGKQVYEALSTYKGYGIFDKENSDEVFVQFHTNTRTMNGNSNIKDTPLSDVKPKYSEIKPRSTLITVFLVLASCSLIFMFI
jgi:hypothetical protein